MSNVVSLADRLLKPAAMLQSCQNRHGVTPLLTAFAHHRRRPGDAFWLKENAELLGILAALGHRLPDLGKAVYQPFYEGAAAQLALYPQYYRLILAVVTALEDLGYPGSLGPRLAQWIAREGWPESEVNDLQRAEVRFLLARNGVNWDPQGLDARLTAFISRSETFALPNPRAAYDLLHVIFYLSHYGRCVPAVPAEAVESLWILGSLAHLEQNGDLLAETCLALHFLKIPMPALWVQHARQEAASIRIDGRPCGDSSDRYHNYLVNQWLLGTMGEAVFGVPTTSGPMSIHMPQTLISPLREFSQALIAPGLTRGADWPALRALCSAHVSPQALAVADAGAEGSPGFARFIQGFARLSHPGDSRSLGFSAQQVLA